MDQLRQDPIKGARLEVSGSVINLGSETPYCVVRAEDGNYYPTEAVVSGEAWNAEIGADGRDGQTATTEPAESAIDGRRVVRAAVVWLPGLAVALGAAAATAHGLFEVALAARVPAGIAWLYPLITDGLALVAYAATARLHGRAARYAWAVVVLAAGLSGLAQAALPRPAAPPSTHPRCCGSGSAPGPRSPPRSSRTCSTSWPPTPHTPSTQKQVFRRHRSDQLVHSPPRRLFNQPLISQLWSSPFNRPARPVSSQPARVQR